MARRRKRRKWIIGGAVLVVALIVLSALPRAKPRQVRVAAAWRMDELKAVVNGSGEIRTKDSVDIQAEIAGVIIELPVEEGDRVEKDQVLLKIDPFQTMADVDAARASLSALEAEAKGKKSQVASSLANAARYTFLKKSADVGLLQAEANFARTRAIHRREGKLLKDNLISPDQFEVSETQLKVDEAQVDAARAKIQELEAQIKAAAADVEFAKAAAEALQQRIEGARSTLSRAEDLLKKTTIRSPLSGVVVRLNVEVGERAVPGIQSNPIATLMTVADLGIIEAELQVDETDIVDVKLGDLGKVVVDALPPDKELAGRVVEIGNSPIATGASSQEGKDFKVVLRIDAPPSSLRPGMSCEADITTAVRENVLVIPIQALTMRDVPVDAEGRYMPPAPGSKASGIGLGTTQVTAAEPDARGAGRAGSAGKTTKELQGVFIVGPDALAHFRPVKTGILGEMEVEVLDGLGEGDEVVVGPLDALRTLEENTPVVIDRSRPFERVRRHGFAGKDSPGEGR